MPANPEREARRRRPTKRDDILDGAVRVFGRVGYARASIEGIAAEARVSTRTIYKHFDGKEQLFETALLTSATTVATAFEADLASLDVGAQPIEDELAAVADALLRQPIDHPDHFAMVRQIAAEAAHFPTSTIASWHEAGPRRVERAVAERLARLAAHGALRVTDRDRAASHFIAVTTAEITQCTLLGAKPLPERVMRDRITGGVTAFLDGYRSRHSAVGRSSAGSDTIMDRRGR